MTSMPWTGERRASWLELFFDLAFAAAVAEVSGVLSADYSPGGLARFGFLFLLIWSAWVGHAVFSSRFETDDLVQRFLTLGQMFAVAIMAVNADGHLDARSGAGFAAAYAALRLILAGQYWRAARSGRAGRAVARHSAMIGAGAVLWLASSFADPPLRYALWALALLLDLTAPYRWTGRSHLQSHPGHLPERFGLFTLILLGESLVLTMAGMKHHEYWSVAAALAAAVGMGIPFAIWWCYYDALQAAAPRRLSSAGDPRRGRGWSLAHLPLCFGIALLAVGTGHVITLVPRQDLRGADALLLSGGMSLVLLALALIASTSDGPARRSVGPGFLLAGGTLLVGAVGGGLPAVGLLALLLGAALVQVVILGRTRR